MVAAILEASRYIDAKANRASVAKLIADKAYVNAPEDVIVQRFMGNFDNGIGKRWQDPNLMKFYEDGKVSFRICPTAYGSLTQHKRWGLLKSDPDYLAIAKQVNQIELYTQAAAMAQGAGAQAIRCVRPS